MCSRHNNFTSRGSMLLSMLVDWPVTGLLKFSLQSDFGGWATLPTTPANLEWASVVLFPFRSKSPKRFSVEYD